MSSRAESVTHRTAVIPGRLQQGPKRRIWRLQYGPCWCNGLPGETGSFDFVRTSTRDAALGNLEFNILILSDRVIDGSRPLFLQVQERAPAPRLVVATAACPAATSFWNGLPVGWTPVQELIHVDLHIDECVSGHPEALMAAMLNYTPSQQNSAQPGHGLPRRTAGQAERDAVAH